jgi:methylmalonyl-CoA mutase
MKVSFEEFDKHGSEQWMNQLKKELDRVAKSVDTLRFHPDRFLNNQQEKHNPVAASTTPWLIREDFNDNEHPITNNQLLSSLENGVQSAAITLHANSYLPALLKNVLLDAVHLNWKCVLPPRDHYNKVIAFLANQSTGKEQLKGSFECDPLAHLLETGNWFESEKADLNGLTEGIEAAHNSLPNYSLLNISGQLYHNAGGTSVQEIWMTLAHLSEYLAYFKQAGLPVATLEGKIQLTVAAGTDYFTEIAKQRALRLLTSQLLAAYGFKNTNCHIHSESSYWHMSFADQHLNVLRTTSAAMSAIIGGCNSLSILPFNCARKENTSTAQRIARNIQHILLEESYMDKSFDPAAGSYFIERLTDDLAENAWLEFQRIEKKGGFLDAIKSGTVQEVLAKEAKKAQQDVLNKERIVLGVNRHLNPNDNNNQLPQPEESAQDTAAFAVTPLSLSRLAAPAEAQRDQFS